jgi:protein TonB
MKSAKKIRWEDVIFFGHNKHYGAYRIRRDYLKNLTWAAIITVAVTLLLLTFPMISNYFFPQQEEELHDTKEIKYTQLSAPPPIQKNVVVQPKVYDAPPVRKVIKYVPPKVTREKIPESVQEDIPTVAEANTNDVGAVAVEGSGEVMQEYVVIEEDLPEEDVILERVEKMPYPKGGLDALRKFLSKNLRYPSGRTTAQGRVIVVFVVNVDGAITDVEIEKGIDRHLDGEALRVTRKMPNWEAGVQGNKPVRVRMRIPITFQIQQIN